MSLARDRRTGSGTSIVFLDESGFMLQPVRRRTWAPRGQTPIQRVWDRHDRWSVISALTLSPNRRRIGFWFDLHDQNIKAPQLMEFLRELRRQTRRKMIVVCDRYSVHRSALKQLSVAAKLGPL